MESSRISSAPSVRPNCEKFAADVLRAVIAANRLGLAEPPDNLIQRPYPRSDGNERSVACLLLYFYFFISV